MQLETPSPNDKRRTVHQTHIFPTRGPGPGDVLPNAAQGLGERYRCGADVTGAMELQMAEGTDPHIHSTADWMRSRFSQPGTICPEWRDDRDHGEIPGTNRYFRDKNEFIEAFDIDGLDHIGHVGARNLTPIIKGLIFPSEFRSGPPANYNELYRQFRFTDNPLPEDVAIEICLLDEDMGSHGQVPQVRIIEKVMVGGWAPMTIDELITQNIIEGVSEHVGEIGRIDWKDLFGYFRR